jgi:hypothetical protein
MVVLEVRLNSFTTLLWRKKMEQLFAVLILLLGLWCIFQFGWFNSIFIQLALLLDPTIEATRINELNKLVLGQFLNQPEITQVTNFMTATGLNGFIIILVLLILIQGLASILSKRPFFLVALIYRRDLLQFKLEDDLTWSTKFFLNWFLYSFDKNLSKIVGLINSDRSSLFDSNSIEYSQDATVDSDLILSAIEKSEIFLRIAKFFSRIRYPRRNSEKCDCDQKVFKLIDTIRRTTKVGLLRTPKLMNNYEVALIYFTFAAYSGVRLNKSIVAKIFGLFVTQEFSNHDYENVVFLINKFMTPHQFVGVLRKISFFLIKNERQEVQRYMQSVLTLSNSNVNTLSSCEQFHNYLLGKEKL